MYTPSQKQPLFQKFNNPMKLASILAPKNHKTELTFLFATHKKT